jgi:hypothetical protein
MIESVVQRFRPVQIDERSGGRHAPSPLSRSARAECPKWSVHVFDRLGVRDLFALLLVLACVLITQFVLAEHGIEHAFHDHEEACIECLALPGFAAVPVQQSRVPPPLSMPAATPATVPPVLVFALHLAFRSRAPPELHD